MLPITRLLILFIGVILVSAGTIFAQRNVTPAIDRDPLLETDAKLNLDVARQGFAPLKRAYKQVILRFEETYAAYPDFSQMDEFLYLAGMSSWYLSENKGRQKVDLKNEKDREKFAPAKLKENAVAYLSMLIEKYPDSKYRADAEKNLKLIKPDK